jgi:hypothetical protein
MARFHFRSFFFFLSLGVMIGFSERGSHDLSNGTHVNFFVSDVISAVIASTYFMYGEPAVEDLVLMVQNI